MYRTWVNAFCGAVEQYSFGSTRGEAASVEAGLQTRVEAVLKESKRKLASLAELQQAALEENDNLPRALEEELLGQRLAAVCAKWKQRAIEAVEAFDDSLLQSHVTEDNGDPEGEIADTELDAILERAAGGEEQQHHEQHHEQRQQQQDQHHQQHQNQQQEEQQQGSPNDAAGPSSHGVPAIHISTVLEGGASHSRSATPRQRAGEPSPRIPPAPPSPPSREDQAAKLKALEEEAERLAAERLHVERMRLQRGESVLHRVVSTLESERAAKLAEAVQLAEEMTDAAPPPDDEEDPSKHLSSNARAEIAEIASRNEGLVHKLAELEGLRVAAETSGKEEAVAEHRKEIEKLKAEGETLAQRMVRLQEEREAAEKVAKSAARAELDEMRNQQKGRTKKKGQDVTEALTREEDAPANREELDRLRDERQDKTRLTAAELAEQAEKARQVEVSRQRVVEEMNPLDSIKSRLAEAERERIAALMALHAQQPQEITLSTEVSSMLANIEQRLQAHEDQKQAFQRRVEDMDERKNSRLRQRDEQAAQRARREEEKRKEEEEFAQFQAERKRKMDEKKRFREIKERGERGELPKYRVCVLGPKSGKTALVKRFVEGSFVDEVDPAIDRTYDKPYSLKGGDCLLQVVDTTGMEEFVDFRKGWYSSCDGFLVVFDLTRKPKRTFKLLKGFGEILKAAKGKESLADIPIVLVGQKEDLIDKRKIKAGEALTFAKEWGAKYVEVSAKTGENVGPAFETVVSLIDAKNNAAPTTTAAVVEEQANK